MKVIAVSMLIESIDRRKLYAFDTNKFRPTTVTAQYKDKTVLLTLDYDSKLKISGLIMI